MTRVENYFAPLPATTRGQPVRLTVDPTGTKVVYASGKSIVVRSLEDPSQAWEYTGHTAPTTVARFSPSGYYVASGDSSGKVRIWDAVNNEHILKSEFQPIAGRVTDIAWDGESKRVMAVGDGKGGFGHVFTFDSGNSVGTVMGHSKVINACSMRQQRPFRAVTCSDDSTCVFYHGAPYKMATVLRDHTGFVHDAQYAPSDEYFVTAGADGKLFLYDGKSGELVRQVGAQAQGHTGSIYAAAWSPDSTHVVTVSGDRTCKFWDIAADKLVGSVEMGAGPEHMQVGCAWAGDRIVTLSLNGNLSFLRCGAAAPERVVTGHQKSITAATVADGALYTASYDGRVCAWDLDAGTASVVVGAGSGGAVEAAAAHGATVALASQDNTLRFVAGDSVARAVPLGAAARSLAFADDAVVAVLQDDAVALVRDSNVERLAIGGAIRAVAARGTAVAIGFADSHVQLYKLRNSQLEPTVSIAAHSREITALAFSDDGTMIASGDAGGKIVVSRTDDASTVTTRWGAHTARVYSIAWAADGDRAVSAALDGHVIVWSVSTPQHKHIVRNAHLGGAVAAWFIGAQVVSTGADGAVKVWAAAA
ncbi:WD40 repeat-like protein [Coemansia sp. RSA 353]|nr:WD40 repeat-like protein [Coemansia sp. RSA 353]